MRYRQLRLNYYATVLLTARAYLWGGDYGNALTEARKLTDDPQVREFFPVDVYKRQAYRRIYELIARQISFGLNPAEEEELECWLKESEENRLLHSRLTDPHYLIRQEEKRNSVDVKKHWRIVRNRLTESKINKGCLLYTSRCV